MNCQSARDTFAELLDHRTPPTAHVEARAHLASCPDCQREFAALSQTLTALDTLPIPTPTARLRKNFYAILEEEKHSAASVRAAIERSAVRRNARRVTLWRWVLAPLAAAALLALGFALGRRTLPAAAGPAPDSVTKQEIALLRDQMNRQSEQINKMNTLFSWQLMQQQQSPTNDRLREVLAAAKTENPTDRVLDDLVQAMMLDPVANVRLSVIDALYRHAQREMVRAGVVAALPREQNPLVQLGLIELAAVAQDPDAAPVLERISADESVNASVRDAARLALAQL